MITLTVGLYFIAFVLTLINGITNRVPLWIPLLLVTIGLMLGGYSGHA